MFDQAEALRALFRDKIMCCSPSARAPRVQAIAVTSGKGGVGKTSIAVNIALLLARSGRRVRLVDADFGLSNAEVLLGVTPRYGLADVLSGRVDARDAWVDTPGGVRLLSSGSGLADMANLDGATGRGLVAHVLSSATDGEVVVVDTSPGIDDSVVAVLAAADEVLMVTTPEPTAITDTYAGIKVLMGIDPDAEITLIANCCASPSQASAVAKGLDEISHRFLGRSFARYEYLPRDSDVGRAVQRQVPLVELCPQSPAASWLRKIAIKLDDRMRKREAAADAAVDEDRLVGV